jgi:dihydroorotate dehydrogenase (NAD+) catalytic subunit
MTERIDVGGIKLINPTMLAAGILGSTASSLKRIMLCGAGAVVTKSVGLMPREGHAGPVLVEVPAGYLNAMGLPNMGLAFMDELAQLRKEDKRAPIIVSIFGDSADEFVELAEKFHPFADAFELNLSCPHAQGFGIDVGAEPAVVEALTNSVCIHVDLPVWVKLTPNVTDVTAIGRAAENGGADALVAINTVKGMAIDVTSGKPILGNIVGGLSGRAIKPIALRCVYDLYSSVNIPIVGVGGISNSQDALEFIMAGARAVQIGSAVAKDLCIFEHIVEGINGYLTANHAELDDIVGLAHGL